MSRTNRAKRKDNLDLSEDDVHFLQLYRKDYKVYKSSSRPVGGPHTFPSYCFDKIAKDHKIWDSFPLAQQIWEALSPSKPRPKQLMLIAQTFDQIHLWYNNQSRKAKHEHNPIDCEDSQIDGSRDSKDLAQENFRSCSDQDVQMTDQLEKSTKSKGNPSIGFQTHDNEDAKEWYRAESNSISDSNNEVMNPDSSISKIYDNAQKYQNGSTSIRSHESLHQNSHPSDEHDKYNNPRNDGDSQGELPEDPCFKADPNYNPFDNEEDYKLPEETTLEDESNLWFVHQGFENEGNNWFMIAIVQMLLSIPEFVQHFYDLEFSKKNQFSGLVHLLARTVFSERPDLAEIDTLRKLSGKEFPLYRQHDACKYMLHLFENLQNELNPSAPHFVSSGYENYAEAWMEYSTKHNSIIDELFVGMHETVIKCNRWTEETRTYEEFTNIPLAIEKDESGDKVLKFFEEQKEIVSFKYYCSVWDLCTPWTIYNRIWKAPKFLMLSIQRFDQATLKKINDDLFYPTDFKLELPGKKKVSYDLKTVICHSGELNEGHYLAYCKRKDDWKCYNDDCVIESEVIEAINEDAYMLVYKVQDN